MCERAAEKKIKEGNFVYSLSRHKTKIRLTGFSSFVVYSLHIVSRKVEMGKLAR